MRAAFVGHPDARAAPPDKFAARRALQIADGERMVALMPGSRPAELRQHLPLFAADDSSFAKGRIAFCRDCRGRRGGGCVSRRAAGGGSADGRGGGSFVRRGRRAG